MRKFFVVALLAGVSLGLLVADGGANHQVRNMHFGVSGGNVNDVTKRFCCSGTLGALLEAGGTQYVLSNNHILARQDKAVAGEDISQPGLVDNNCQTPPIVADFTVAHPLGDNVDAAIAQVRQGQMDPTGFIEDVGLVLTNPRAPSVGLAVAKSGRTTGFTTGSITSINTNVNVQYQARCGNGKKTVLTYTNQVIAASASGSFSGGGDSGALIVSWNPPLTCPQPVALLFAGNAAQTVGNPIGEVLAKLSASLGSPLSFVGAPGCVTAAGAGAAAGAASGAAIAAPGPSQNDIDFATMIKDRHAPDLMAQPEIIGVGVGAADGHPEQAAVVLFVDSTRPARPRLPETLDGVPVKVVATQPFVAY